MFVLDEFFNVLWKWTGVRKLMPKSWRANEQLCEREEKRYNTSPECVFMF